MPHCRLLNSMSVLTSKGQTNNKRIQSERQGEALDACHHRLPPSLFSLSLSEAHRVLVRAAGMLLVRVLAGVAARAMPVLEAAEVLEQDWLLAAAEGPQSAWLGNSSRASE